ncbi:GntR family transcriptional regulator [Ruania halotolerans]|uniref:GntR family transcriptional regulator n=1 Tax=Ruania halotolerans TaxID=2897773 RepID=UPI001E528AAC|nr:GntR family transcriptional regulator [Ruania halotolerans]UFU07519.1 GntR family transcriptional regulator [Ruania halotolerans]
MLPDPSPAHRLSTAELIAEQLRSAIMTGTLTPGEQLGEADIATRFEVSRGPVREALQRLVSEGIAHSVRHRGIFVPELDLADMIDVYRSRAVIERGAGRIILESDREGAWRVLGAPLQAMTRAAERGDPTGVSNADQAFHEAFVEAAGSPRLIRALRTLLVETRICLGELQTTYPDLGEQVREHEEWREALRTGTPEELDAVIDAHLIDAVQRLEGKLA